MIQILNSVVFVGCLLSSFALAEGVDPSITPPPSVAEQPPPIGIDPSTAAAKLGPPVEGSIPPQPQDSRQKRLMLSSAKLGVGALLFTGGVALTTGGIYWAFQPSQCSGGWFGSRSCTDNVLPGALFAGIGGALTAFAIGKVIVAIQRLMAIPPEEQFAGSASWKPL